MNAVALKQNKWVRRIFFVVLAILAFWLLAWLAVPPLVKSQLQKIATDKLGRQVTVGSVEFTPWTLEIALNDLAVASADGKQAQLQIKRVYADAELQSLLRLAPVIDAVTIDSPVLNLTHAADGSYDIDDVLGKLASASAAPAAEPPKFSIYNVVVSGGAVDFNDLVVKRMHRLRALQLQVPFLSNLPSQRDITTEPKLAFVLNGSPFDSTAFSTPFAASRKTDAQFNFKGLDLAPYLGYLPGGLPVRLLAGTLDADLKLVFERGATTGLKLTGSVEAHGAKLVDARGGDLLRFDSLKLDLADVRPLEQLVHLSAVTLSGPQLAVARDAGGQLNLLATNPATGATTKVALPVTTKTPAASAAAAGADGPPAANKSAAKALAKPSWKIRVDSVALQNGKLSWSDQTTRPAAAVTAADLALQVRAVTWPMSKPATFSGGLSLQGAPVKFQGSGTDQQADVVAEVDALPLSIAAPYLAQSLEPTLNGKLSGQVDMVWKKQETAADLRFTAKRVLVADLALVKDKASLASIGKIELTDTELDMTQHTLVIGALSATQPKVTVERDTDKHWMYERWLKTPAGASAGLASAAPVGLPNVSANANANVKPWQLSIAKLAVDGGAVSYADRASETPAVLEVTALNIQAGKIAPGAATETPLQVSGRIGSGRRADPGRFDYKGKLVLKPLRLEGQLDATGIPVHAFKTYYQDVFNNVDVRRAFLGYRGTLAYADGSGGLSLKLLGDTVLEDFRASSSTLTQARGIDSSDELLSWKALGLRGLQLTLAPGAAPTVDVRETTLTDFFARVIVDETGKLNLQNLSRAPAGPSNAMVATAPRSAAQLAATPTPNSSAAIELQPAVPGAPAPAPVAAGAGPATMEVTTRPTPGGGTTTSRPALPVAGAPGAVTAVAGAAPALPSSTASGLTPVIRFGPMSLVNGKVDFTDNFVKPNYSADLTALTGKLSAFSSIRVDGALGMADLELRGKAQQTAALEILGKINPLGKPLVLDITAKMSDLDLPPLSPYAVRYAGHGIERGKLSMEVKYEVKPDGQLTASNKLVLNQLRFGEAVAGAPNSLPVRLAVALLADRNGVIDVDLPLTGSLNDPQFSIGPLIFKAILNLIAKAVVAPFALLTGGFGGDKGESSAITFESGSVLLSGDATQNLDKVAKALLDRPGLKLTVVGTANLEKERNAYQHQRLRDLAQTEKRRAAERAEQGAATPEVTPVSDAEYPALLAAVYKRADITKPRNMVGLTKELPTPEMENLLLASIPVDENAIRGLAVERGIAVRDYLLAQKLTSDRLFLGAVRTGGGDAKWKPAAELNLATN